MTAVTVVIATCDRPHELSECLLSMARQSHSAAEVIVVDDAPGDARVPAVVNVYRRLVPVRYVRGRRGGLADAHNLGVAAAGTPIVALTDDDVIADAGWLEALVSAFASTPNVGCVTGCIRPLELATPAQELLECYARYDKGDRRQVFDLETHRPPDRMFPFAAGTFGSGANMAFDRTVLNQFGGFDAALGAGTWARGGDDLAAFFEVLQRGHRLVYEPAALVRHRHSRDLEAVRRQAFGYGVGLTAFLTKCLVDRPRLTVAALRGAPAAVRHVVSPQSVKNAGHPPARIKRAERLGMLIGPIAYLASRFRVRRTG